MKTILLSSMLLIAGVSTAQTKTTNTSTTVEKETTETKSEVTSTKKRGVVSPKDLKNKKLTKPKAVKANSTIEGTKED